MNQIDPVALTISTLAMCRAACAASLESGSTPLLRKLSALVDAMETAERQGRTLPPSARYWHPPLGYYDAMSQEQSGLPLPPAELFVVRAVGSILARALGFASRGTVSVLVNLSQMFLAIEHGMWAEGRRYLGQAAGLAKVSA